MTSGTTAYVLAAGAGRKFWPFNEVRNKTAFPVANTPIVRRLTEQLLSAGVQRLVLGISSQDGSVRAAMTGLEERIWFVPQAQTDGTASTLLRCLDAVPPPGPFVVAYGDVVTTEETVQSVVHATQEEALGAAVVSPLEAERAGNWITISVQNGALAGFAGHGRGGSHRLGGLYALRPEIVPALRANPGVMTHVPVGGMPAPEFEIAETLAALTDRGESIQAIEASGFLIDVDKPWHVLLANRSVLMDMSDRLGGSSISTTARIHDSAELSGRVILGPNAEVGARVVARGDLWLGPNASVTNGSILEGRCLVGDGARVKDYALIGGDTTLGPGSLCGHGAEFTGVLLDGAYLYHYCELWGVLGSKVDVGAATVCGTLRFDDSSTIHRIQGRPEIPEEGANASYLGDYSRTGVNAILMPGVKTGAYSCVGAGVVLYDDLPSREMVLLKQDLVRKRWGPERYGW